MLISIIVPVYNNERYVLSAVNSVMEQKADNIEVILVDDGSTDHTPQVLDRLADEYQNVQVIHQENQWIYASFNNGIKSAMGEYIYILNSDDRLHENSLLLLLDKIEEYNHPDVIWTKVIEYQCNERQEVVVNDVFGTDKLVEEERYFGDPNQVRNGWVSFVQTKLACNQANLYKRELAIKHPFRNDVYGADFFFNIQIAPDVKTALILKEQIYEHYLYGQEGMNASVGKFYGYEHEMQNEMYLKYVDLFSSWGFEEEQYMNVLKSRRLKGLTSELRMFMSKQCPFCLNEKMKRALNQCLDDIVIQCGSGKFREEMESRILSAMRDMLVVESMQEDDEMYFVYELLESLLRYEKDKEDYKRIELAINHPLNPFHIGKCFYNKLQGIKESEFPY